MDKQQLLESLRNQGFSDEILKAFEKVQREKFISPEIKAYAYEDNALPIGESQTISQPYTIAVMLNLLDLKHGQKVLEIGSGSGYVVALLSEIVGKQGKVLGIEIIKSLAENSKQILKEEKYKNVKVYNKDGALGLSNHAPFDRILISAALKEVPREVLKQLKNNGILVAPIGGEHEQTITAIQRKGNKYLIKNKIPGFRFVRFV